MLIVKEFKKIRIDVVDKICNIMHLWIWCPRLLIREFLKKLYNTFPWQLNVKINCTYIFLFTVVILHSVCS